MLILHLRPDLASTAIESYLGPFFETIFQHKSAIIRQSNMLILSKALLILTAQPNDYLHIANKDHPVVQIMLKMLNALGDVGKNHNKMAEYWQLMFEMCFMSKDCCRWLQANMLGPKLVHFVMEKDSPLLDQLPIYPYSAANKKVECINTLLKILSLIVPF